MNNPNDPAYPMQRVTGLHTGNPIPGHPGMTIRQQFVMAAMEGLCSSTDEDGAHPTGWLPALACMLADATLAEEARTRSTA